MKNSVNLRSKCVITSAMNCTSMYRVGQKTDTILKVDNFATASDKQECDMSKFSKFGVENK